LKACNTGFVILCLLISTSAQADLTLTSPDYKAGDSLTKEQEFKGFGCDGKNVSPRLVWSGAPKDTKSFALIVYDPDAPTGSGWWHWQLVNIPNTKSELVKDAGNKSGKQIPRGAMQIENDYGFKGFGGACPPKGDKAHRYQFTIHALKVKKLDLPKDASGALASFNIRANTIESATLELVYKRD
jgi:Raf kinase inhibitor-like YbhB/YbcL family protein